jgi:hypothetical protein
MAGVCRFGDFFGLAGFLHDPMPGVAFDDYFDVRVGMAWSYDEVAGDRPHVLVFPGRKLDVLGTRPIGALAEERDRLFESRVAGGLLNGSR